MISAHIVLMILAIICLVLAAFEVSSPRVNLMAAGLALWAIATLVT